jgi:hypothetical protein
LREGRTSDLRTASLEGREVGVEEEAELLLVVEAEEGALAGEDVVAVFLVSTNPSSLKKLDHL